MDAFESAKALFFEGLQHLQRKEFAAAESRFKASLDHVPDRVSTMNNLSLVLIHQRKYAEARDLIATITVQDAKSPEAWLNLGLIERDERHDHATALLNFNRALALRADYAEAHLNRAFSYNELKRYDEAHDGFARALAIDPNMVEAQRGRALTLWEMKRYAEAIDAFDAALTTDPDYGYLIGERLYAKMQICDWVGIDDDWARISAKIDRGERAALPFQILSFTDDSKLQRQAIEIWARDQVGIGGGHRSLSRRASDGKIRVGYFSADFRTHPVALLSVGMFEHHDRSRFEIFGFSYGPDSSSDLRQRLVRAFDAFHDVRELSDADIARFSRDKEIDIAVDLTGYTQHCRPGIFIHGCAPIQVSHLGYAGTTATQAMDYIIADHTLIPEDARVHFSEKVAYLPDSYQPNDDTRPIADKTFTRRELSLPESGFVFCCFNNSYKITPDVFSSWMRILHRVPASVLWFRQNSQSVVDNLRDEAKRRGADPDRLVFAERVASMDLHLARHRTADLFLDTAPFNAHTTASDALWAGLPVLTCPGGTLASRVAASLLNAVDLGELVVQDRDSYERLAVELALDPERLAQIRRKLAQKRGQGPLFQTATFTKYIEDAYAQMYQRYQAGSAPDHIFAGRSVRSEAAKVNA